MIVTDKTIARIRLRCSGMTGPVSFTRRGALLRVPRPTLVSDRFATGVPAPGRSRSRPMDGNARCGEARQPGPGQRAMPRERLEGVFGAGRQVAAARSVRNGDSSQRYNWIGALRSQIKPCLTRRSDRVGRAARGG